jgi:arsenate reductase
VLALIRNAGIEPEVIEYVQSPPDRATLIALLSAMNMTPRQLLRRKGTPYDELGLDDASVSDDTRLDAMLAHPILIERPIVVTEYGTRLCRPSEVVLDIMPQPQRGPFRKEDGDVVIDAQNRRVR